jgi:subtilisin family serine protease
MTLTRTWIALCGLAASLAAVAIFAPGARADQAVVPDEIIVGVRAGTAVALGRGLTDETGAAVGYIPELRAYRVKLFRGVNQANALARFKRRSDVLYAHPSRILHAVATPNDPYYPTTVRQYGPQKMQANLAWDVYQPKAKRIIAIVDTGVDYSHPDLVNSLVRDPDNPDPGTNVVGYNAQTGTDDARDDHGHGTHVAGTAAAEINNGIGIAGIAGWNPNVAGSKDWVKIMPVKVLNMFGSGTDFDVAAGITWATDHGANIISMSLGDVETSPTLDAAVAYAWNHGLLVVAAAGNMSSNSFFYPAASPNVLSVAATDNTDTLASFSNWGEWVKVAAPGVNVYATLPTYSAGGNYGTNYGYLSGTSMATPHVSGEAALIWAHAPTLTNAQISAIIQDSTDPFKPYNTRTIIPGGGRANAYKAILATATPPTVPGAPGSLVATGADSLVALSWTAPAGAKSYNVKRATVTGGPYTTVKSQLTATSYQDTSVTNGTKYFYVVSATNTMGEGPNSAEASATPSLPTGTVLRINSGGPQYTATTGVFQADKYFTGGVTIDRGPIAIGGTSDPALYRTIRYNVSFGYSIPVDNGTYSLTLHFAETGGYGANVRKFKVSVNGATWLPSLDVYAEAGANKALKKSTTVTVTNGKIDLAFASLNSLNSFVNAIEVASLDGAPPSGNPPAAPTGLSATAGDTQIALAWTGSTGADSYNIKRATTAGGPYTTVKSANTTTSYTDTGLSNGTKYFYVVSAVNGYGESGNSNEASATPLPPPPAAPTGLSASGGDAQVSLSWTASTGATSYNVKRATTTGGPYTTIKSGNATTAYTDTGLSNGTKYFYVVTAVNLGGESGSSNEASATPLPPAPAAPTNLGASPGDSQVTLSWTASTGATSYNIKRATTTGGPYTTVKSGNATTSYADTGLTNGTKYFYVVTAVNLGGESGNSNEAFATPSAAPAEALRINSGGPLYNATTGVFIADKYFTSGQTVDRGGITVSGTSDSTLYRTMRYNVSFGYSIPVANGTYTLTLHFAETGYNGAGIRKFKVDVNGTNWLPSLDVFAEAGWYKALKKTTTVTVTNGKIDLSFVSLNSMNAFVNAIEVAPAP